MAQILNWQIIKNPFNWVIVLLMLVIGGIGGAFVLSYVGVEPATSDSQPSTVSTTKPS
jgi:hypothetical protein